MKILYVAPYCFGLEKSMADALRRRGCEVEEIIYDKYDSEKSAVEKKIYDGNYAFVRRAKKVLSAAGILNFILSRRLAKINDSILRAAAAFAPDIVFIIKGEVVFPETLAKLSKIAMPVSYHWDDPFLRHAAKMDATDDIRYKNITRNIPYYGFTFVYDPSYIKKLEAAGAKNVSYLMDWYEPEIYKPLNLSAEEKKLYGSAVSFVGAPYENRAEILSAISDCGLGIWGPYFRWNEYFDRYPALRKSYKGESPGGVSAKVYNASAINLNIHDTHQCFESANNRTFQIIACGAFQIVDDRKKLYEIFEVGKDIETYGSAAELKEKISFFTANPAARAAIAASGLKKAAAHSADERARMIMETIK